MKEILLFLVAALMLASCGKRDIYYQVYETSGNVVNNSMNYENANCKVSYNLWEKDGNAGFKFENKSNQTIYIDLSQSFFVKNGIAYNYFLDREYTVGGSNSESLSNTNWITGYFKNNTDRNNTQVNTVKSPTLLIDNIGVSETMKVVNTKNKSITQKEQKIIAIPAGTSKFISEYSINNNLWRDCGIRLYPSKNQENEMTFNQSNTPIQFGNIIVYTIGEGSHFITINNDFYVSKIKNISAKNAYKEINSTDCEGKKIKEKVMMEYGNNKFFITYPKTDAKH